MSATAVVDTPPVVSSTTTTNFNYAIGYLKAAIVACVVALHSVLAYHPAAPPPPVSLLAHPRTWLAFPVFDSHHAAWAGVLATVADMFGMALIFFLSGLFVWSSLKRKGPSAYMRNRLLRLGVPFVAVAVIITPLSYYPTYLQIAGHGGFGDFLRQWLALGRWSAGPAWFCWVLLVFDWIAASLIFPAPRWGEMLGRVTGRVTRHPELFFLLWVAMTAAVYIPMVLVFGPFSWAAWGPFTFQVSRVLFYLVYFFAGIGVGAWGLERGLFARGGKLVHLWPLWLIVAIVAFLAHSNVVEAVRSHPLPRTLPAALQSRPVMAALILFAVFCAAACFTCLALFMRFVNSRIQVFDNLSRNAYGIFLIHFVFVSWIGYALSTEEAPALVKFALVSTGALAMSWFGTILIRRIPGAARII
jgi:hypothetical protein